MDLERNPHTVSRALICRIKPAIRERTALNLNGCRRLTCTPLQVSRSILSSRTLTPEGGNRLFLAGICTGFSPAQLAQLFRVFCHNNVFLPFKGTYTLHLQQWICRLNPKDHNCILVVTGHNVGLEAAGHGLN
jgi:hypothetical protein